MQTSVNSHYVDSNIAVVIIFLDGSFSDGFKVDVQILRNGQPVYKRRNPTYISGREAIPEMYKSFRSSYASWSSRYMGDRAINSEGSNFSGAEACENYVNNQKTFYREFKEWITDPIWTNLGNEIADELSRYVTHSRQSFPLIFSFKNSNIDKHTHHVLCRLPLNRWDLISRKFLGTQATLSVQSFHGSNRSWIEKLLNDFNYRRAMLSIQLRSLIVPLKVLAIYGSDTTGLMLEEDLEVWENIESSSNIDIESLREPTSGELRIALERQSWDALFFAGHSRSLLDTGTGEHTGELQIGKNLDGSPIFIQVNTIYDELQIAKDNGLKLAIFNSCDGLGIADNLSDIGIPTVIAMKEPVPDIVAHRFIAHFLEAFAISERPFYSAVRTARRRLNDVRDNNGNTVPAAPWLPVVFQDPTQSPPQNPRPRGDLGEFAYNIFLQFKSLIFKLRRLHWTKKVMIGALLTCVLLISLSILGDLFPPGIYNEATPKFVGESRNLSFGEEILAKDEANNQDFKDSKRIGVNAFETLNAEGYGLAIKEFKSARGKAENSPETLIYHNNALIEKALIDHEINDKNVFTLAVVVPLKEGVSTNEKGERDSEFDAAMAILRGVAQAQDMINSLRNDEEKRGEKYIRVLIANDYSYRGALKDPDSYANDKYSAEDVAKKIVEINKKDWQLLGVVGHDSSEATTYARAIYKNAQIPSISPTSTSTCLSLKCPPDNPEEDEFGFRTVPKDTISADKISELIKNQYETKASTEQRVAIIFGGAKQDDDKSNSSSVKKELELRMENNKFASIVDIFELHDLLGDDSKLQSFLKKVKEEPINIIVIASELDDNSISGALITAAKIKEERSEVIVVGSDALYDKKLLDEPRLEGMKVVSFWDRDAAEKENDPDSVPYKFIQAAYGAGEKSYWNAEVNWLTAMSYDAALAFNEALDMVLKNNTKFTGVNIANALRNISSMKGATGTVRFDENGDRVHEGVKFAGLIEVTKDSDDKLGFETAIKAQ